MIITTKDVKVKDQAPEKLTILSTGDIEPKEFVIKGKGKKKIEQTITTSNIKEKEKPLTKDQKDIVADIKKTRKIIADLTKENKKLKAKADAERKRSEKPLTAKEKKIIAGQKQKRKEKKEEEPTGTRDSGRNE